MSSPSPQKINLPAISSKDLAAGLAVAANQSTAAGSSGSQDPPRITPRAKQDAQGSGGPDKNHVLPIESTVSGAVAGLVSRLVIAPLDVVKIRLQLEVDSKPPHGTGRRIFNKLKSIAYQEGFTALFKGNVPAEILYIAYGAAQFTTYKWTSNMLATALPNTSDSAKSFASGATSACVATTLTYPFDLLRTRFAVQATPGNPRIYTSLYQAIRQIYHLEGASGFYRGIAPAVLTMVPYMGLFFMSYEKLTHGLTYVLPTTQSLAESSNDTPSIPKFTVASLKALLASSHEAIAGLLAGIFAKTALFPFDVVRKRLQVQGPTREKYLSGSIPKYPRNPFITAVMILRQEGILGLYKGLFVSIIKSAPASAVTMWTYEHTLDYMRKLKQDGYITY